MKILHFILGKANPDRANGVNIVINGLAKYSALAGHDIQVVGISKGMHEKFKLVKRDGFEVKVYNSFFGESFNEIKKIIGEVDIVHLHSVWQHYNIILADYLLKKNKPYIITIHSGLTEDRIKQSNYWLKLAYHQIFQKRIFDGASGIHVITKEEMSDVAKYTRNNNIFFVPNGVDLDNYNLIKKEYNESNLKIQFGYLGRFGAEKNISSLIYAIARLPLEYLNKVHCHLIGPIDKEGEQLKKIVEKLELESVIKFTGPLYDSDKYNMLKQLDFYIHPAHSDVVSIAVMEAMASGLPCVITRTSQVSYYYDSKAFIMVEPLIEDIKSGIIEIIDNEADWGHMSQNALNLIARNFNWKNATNRLLRQYELLMTP